MFGLNQNQKDNILAFAILLPFIGGGLSLILRQGLPVILGFYAFALLTIIDALDFTDDKSLKFKRKDKSRQEEINQYNLFYGKYPELFPWIKIDIEEYEDLKNEEEPFRLKAIKNNEVIEDKGFYHPNDRTDYIKNNYYSDNDCFIYDEMLYHLLSDYKKPWVDEIIKTIIGGIDDEIIFNYENCVIKYKFDKNNMTLSGEISIIDEILNERFISRGFQDFVNHTRDEMKDSYKVDLGIYPPITIEKSLKFDDFEVISFTSMLYFITKLNNHVIFFLGQEEDRKELFVKEKVKREVKTFAEDSNKNSLLKSRQI